MRRLLGAALALIPLLTAAAFGAEAARPDGWSQADGLWYYYEDGAPYAGWKKAYGYWYLMDEEGTMLTGWQQVGERWFYLNGDGEMQTGWQQLENRWYYFLDTGEMYTGWLEYQDADYYLDPESGARAENETRRIDGRQYVFGADGVLTSTESAAVQRREERMVKLLAPALSVAALAGAVLTFPALLLDPPKRAKSE